MAGEALYHSMYINTLPLLKTGPLNALLLHFTLLQKDKCTILLEIGELPHKKALLKAVLTICLEKGLPMFCYTQPPPVNREGFKKPSHRSCNTAQPVNREGRWNERQS